MPPIAEARAIVCALISAAKNMTSAATKTIVPKHGIGHAARVGVAAQPQARIPSPGWAAAVTTHAFRAVLGS